MSKKAAGRTAKSKPDSESECFEHSLNNEVEFFITGRRKTRTGPTALELGSGHGHRRRCGRTRKFADRGALLRQPQSNICVRTSFFVALECTEWSLKFLIRPSLNRVGVIDARSLRYLLCRTRHFFSTFFRTAAFT